MADARAVLFKALARGLKPPPLRTVTRWADERRYVAAEASPRPGKWSTETTPYLAEPMACLSPSDPCRSVTAKKSHQLGFTEGGINWFGASVEDDPAAMLIVLPTLDEAKKYNRVKLGPAIRATPALYKRVREEKSRDSRSSTALFKQFPGGYAVITGANSSAGLQMISVRYLLLEEVSEYPDDVDGRGDPVELAEARTTAYADIRKIAYISTPGIKGTCRLSEKYEASDQRRYYVRCPHCGAWQVLEFANLKWASDTPPHGAYFVCAAHGCVIEHAHKWAMVAGGVWIKCWPDDDDPAPPPWFEDDELERWSARGSGGREPGFHIWQAYSPFVSWDDTVTAWLKAKGDPFKVKVFTQQVLGEAYEETDEAPDWEKLYQRREPYPMGRIPPGGLVLTGFCDVQGDRLEWGVYAWGIGLTGWLVDKGVIPGDPAADDVWRALDQVIGRTFENWRGRAWPIEAFGVDSGFMSHRVYLFCRRRPRVFATKGVEGDTYRPLIGTPSKVDINWRGKQIRGGCLLWPLGTWPAKADVYGRLRKTIDGPNDDGVWPVGALHAPADGCDEGHFKQLTAEFLKETVRNGRPVRQWFQSAGQANEQLDIAVGARALASHLGLDRLTPAEWAVVAAERDAPPDEAQRDLTALWAPSPGGSSASDDDTSERRSPVAERPPAETTVRPTAPRAPGGVRPTTMRH